MPIEDDAKVALQQLKAQYPEYRKLQAYFCGDHPLAFATRKFKNAFGDLFREFADNLCPTVIRATAERLRVIGFGIEEVASGDGDDLDVDVEGQGPAAVDQRAAQEAWRIWVRNRMTQRSAMVHQEALLKGDAYVVVWPSLRTGRVTIWPQHAENMTVSYNEEDPGLIDWAAKGWVDQEGHYRLTIYYPGAIYKYRSRSKVQGEGAETSMPETLTSFDSFKPLGDQRWPVPNPYGQVPVFHFGNKAWIGERGVSELHNVMEIQDALNKSILDMMVGMEFVALPQRWATGVEVEADERRPGNQPGRDTKFEPGVDRLWAVEEEAAKFGQFDPANLTQFVEVQDSFRRDIGRISSTPLHYLMLQQGATPSGEAIKVAEGPLTKKVQDRMEAFGNTWEDVMAFALRVAGQEQEVLLSTQWANPEPRSDKEHVNTLFIKWQLGVPRRQALLEMDYPKDKIEQMLREHDQEVKEMGPLMQPLKGGPQQPPSTRGVPRGEDA